MTRSLKAYLPHLFVFFGFIIISLAYFNPVLQNKQIFQSDIVQYTGMAKQQNDFRAATGEEPYWTDAAFGGMPTYQLGANYPHNYVKQLDSVLRFLPRPADYLFLYFIGFYILLLVLKLDYKLAFLGALAFGFSTYLIIILGVGHNAKAHAIAYMPMVIAGIVLIFRSKFLLGFLLLTIAMALEIGANHFQMTYYLLLIVIVLGLAYLYDAFKKRIIPHYFKALGVMVLAVLLAIATNATNLLATQEYTNFSTRGTSQLTIEPDGSEKQNNAGLDYNYITEYSYGIVESFNLLIPRFKGGSNSEDVGKDSQVYEQLLAMGANPAQALDFAQSAPAYWGDQPYVGAPAYLGATILFLFVFALFLIKGRLKWWIVGASVLALLLSWGKNFPILTDFFIDFVPLYNKFRAVSSIQVIIELCVPILAIFGLHRLFNSFNKTEEKQHALKWSLIITGGLSLLFLVFNSVLFNFTGANDSMYIEQMGLDFVRALREDRQAIFISDSIRSLIYILLSAAVIWAFLKEKISINIVIGLFAILILADLVGVDRRYVNNDDFVQARQMEQPFRANAANLQIQEDKSHYRVFDISENPFNTGKTSYFHNSIGGYHAAKPARMQDLYDFYISKNNMDILNMLNVKYFIIPSESGPQMQENPNASGNAWFAKEIVVVNSQNEELTSLGKNDLKSSVILHTENEKYLPRGISGDPDATIELISHQPNELVYTYTTNAPQLAIFSEMYYENGWNAYINDEIQPHFRANYLLRAMMVPEGTNNTITFKFEPEVVKTGSTISLASSILLALLILGSIVYYFKSRKPDAV